MYYFVSDIHLGAGDAQQSRRTERAFCRWLDSVAADARALYLLGDIFDFWFEYRRVVPQGFVRVLSRLAELTDRGVEVHMFIGNHDIWCYDYFTRECGVVMHYAPEVVTLAGRKLHLAHGDNMNIDNQPMLRLLNTVFRSTTARTLFSWLVHPDLALKFGYWWSGKSRKSHPNKCVTPDHLGFLVEYAREHHRQCGDVEEYIFGHMHFAHEHSEEGLRVLFMSDWSGDEAHYVAMSDDGELQLKSFTIDETVS